MHLWLKKISGSCACQEFTVKMCVNISGLYFIVWQTSVSLYKLMLKVYVKTIMQIFGKLNTLYIIKLTSVLNLCDKNTANHYYDVDCLREPNKGEKDSAVLSQIQ